MTFSILETSRHQGKPVTLYLFVYGGSLEDSPPTTQFFAYTDGEQAITYDGVEYEPVPVMREEVVASGSLDKSALAIRLSRDTELATLFQVYPPIQPVTLVIRQGHFGDVDAEFLVVWSGRVLSIGREGDECVISCEPISSSMRRPGLRRHYQIGCPHVLYGAQCLADEAAATVSGTVTAIDGLDITLAGGWEGAFAQAKFLHGMVKWTNDDGGIEIRRILKVTGDVLLLGGFLRDLAVTDSVSVVLGCNHQMDDCLDLHDNIHSFGGCPWIPTKNPTGLRNQYY